MESGGFKGQSDPRASRLRVSYRDSPSLFTCSVLIDCQMPSFAHVVHPAARTAERSPVGSQHQCEATNRRLEEIIEMAKAAWSSPSPAVRNSYSRIEAQTDVYVPRPRPRSIDISSIVNTLSLTDFSISSTKACSSTLYYNNTTLQLLVHRYPDPEAEWLYRTELRLLDPGNIIEAHPDSHVR